MVYLHQLTALNINMDSTHTIDNREALKYKFYSELNRSTLFLFASLLALMSLLLAAGFQRPHKDLPVYMYGAIMSLGLNLLVYPTGRYLLLQFPDNKSSPNKQQSLFRLIQLALFVISAICLMGTALAVTQFFFKGPGA